MKRTHIGVGVLVALAIAVLAATLARRTPPPAPPAGPPHMPPVLSGGDPVALAGAPHLMFRGMRHATAATYVGLASLQAPGAARAATSLDCERISYANGRGLCLHASRSGMIVYDAILFDREFRPTATIPLDGTPSRTRMSPDGRYGATTVFVAGDSYAAALSFSTRTRLIDVSTGSVIGDLEQFSVAKDGHPFTARDFNFWGVTFARDGRTFYATLRTGRTTYLVRGDLAERVLTVVHENVECPSLSPDNRLIAYKKRVFGDVAPWRFYVLDLATLRERRIESETRSIDDQIEWLDDTHVLYAVRRGPHSDATDVWVAPIAGDAPARVFLPEADSPVVVR